MHTNDDPEIARMLISLDDALKRIDAAYIALDQARQEVEAAKISHMLWAEKLREMATKFGQPRPEPKFSEMRVSDVLH